MKKLSLVRKTIAQWFGSRLASGSLSVEETGRKPGGDGGVVCENCGFSRMVNFLTNMVRVAVD
jgi:hypothetical protein